MRFGTLERQAIKRDAKTILLKNLRFCITASVLLVLISLAVSILKNSLTSAIPDFLGLHNLADLDAFYARCLAHPLEVGTELWNFYLYNFLYGQLAHVLGVVLEAPLLLAFMAGLYRIAVYGESPERRSLGAWYGKLGLSARSIGLLFFLDILFEILRLALVFAPLVLMVYMAFMSLASGGALPIWVPLLPLASLGGLVLGAFLYARWLPALHFMAKYPHLGPWGALRKSAQELKGHRFQYIILILSFLPWLLLEAFTYGAAGVYVIPYLELTVTLFLEKIRLPQDPPPEPLPQ